MKFEILSVSLLLSLSLCGCTSSDKSEINHLEKDTEGGVKALGKEADKAGKAISSSVNEPKMTKIKTTQIKATKMKAPRTKNPAIVLSKMQPKR